MTLASIGMMLVFAIDYPMEVAAKKQVAREQIRADYQWLKSDLDKQTKQLKDFFIQSDTLDPSCSSTTLLALRQAHFHISNVAEFGVVNPDGYLTCTSWGAPPEPIKTIGPKPVKSQQLRYFGPIHTNYIGEAALVIAKTRSDGFEINALLPQPLLSRKINELDRPYDFVALVDAKLGVPITIVGGYTLPLDYDLFPLTKTTELNDHRFDDTHQHYLLAEPVKDIPSLALVVAVNVDTLYRGVYTPPLASISLYVFVFVLLFFFSKAYHQNYRSRKNELINHLNSGDFINFYQLIWNANTKQFAGVEVLVRLNHPLEGVLTPNRFLPDIESNNLNLALTYAVIENITEDLVQLTRWHPTLKVNINITGEHLKDDKFKQLALELNTQIPHLVLEITENELIESDDTEVIETITLFREQGVRVAIDDFGTGYAGLQYLKSLPFDILKIDQSYTAAIGTNSQLAILLDALIELAKKLEIDIVAEGVETQAQADYLLAKEVYFHQGWLYHKAQGIEQLISKKL